MTFTTGDRLGPYEIVALLGTGGMGTVYRARDPRVGREVAIKVSAERFSQRFEREARAIATLNHPNICALYDLGANYLVLELVEGDSPSGPQPLNRVLRTARQLADALEAAHAKGVIHRDLKPGNVKITRDGVVKVLDFGLAKMSDEGARHDSSVLLSTDTLPSPDASAIMGTAAYMAPEHVRGETTDKRTDIWAFGVVLYEMLTGRRPFRGESVTDVLRAVAYTEPDWDALPDATPPSIRRLLRRCLEKDPKRRLPDIGVARLEIDDASEPTLPAVARRSRPVWWRSLAAAGVVLAAALIGIVILRSDRDVPTPIVARFSDPIDSAGGMPYLALSPDGRQIVYASDRLYLRSLSDEEVRPIPGSEDANGVASNPVFSPDGQSIAFFSGSSSLGGTIKVIPVTGGAAVSLLQTDFPPFGMTWSGEAILFARSFGKADKGIWRVPASGGREELLLSTGDEFAHGPQILPDGQTILFTLASGVAADRWDKARVVVQSLASGERKTVIEGGSDARLLPSGTMLYARGNRLFAAAFDRERHQLMNDPLPVVDGVTRSPQTMSGAANFAISASGSLVYVSAPTRIYDLAWIDRAGNVETLSGPSGAYQYPRLSPDGKRLAVGTQQGDEQIVWVGDVSGGGALRRLTFVGRSRFPLWSADGARVTFQADRDGESSGIFWQHADGAHPAERLTTAPAGELHEPESWSPSGEDLLFRVARGARFSLWRYSVKTREATPFGDVQSAIPPNATFSPDGRWVAYNTRESDKFLISIQPFPPNGAKYQVVEGGIFPAWSRDGRELYYFHGLTEFAVVRIGAGSPLSVGTPTELWRQGPNRAMIAGPAPHRGFDPVRSGAFLSLVPARSASPAGSARMHVVLNWFDEIERRLLSRK